MSRIPSLLIVTTSAAVLAGGLAPAPASGASVWLGSDPTTASTRTDYSTVIATLRQEIPDLMAAGQVVGLTISLVDGDRTVWQRGFGMANRERDRAVTPQTLFHIGSTSKTMATMAIMQLVERGLVDLDAPLTRYVPEFRLRRGANRDVTIRSILTHHSGIPGDLASLAELGSAPERNFVASILKQLRHQRPTRPVGRAWAYSNLAVTLLQAVVENVTDMPFALYTHRHIFRPLGMTATTFDDAKPAGVRLAAPYQVVPDGAATRVVRRAREYMNTWPAGSVVSNAKDMATYLKAMIGFGKAANGAQVLRSRTVRQMITPQPAAPWDRMGFKMGLIWWIGFGPPWLRQVINHGGDTYSHHTMAAWWPQQRLGVFVSVNTLNSKDVTRLVWQRALGLMLAAKTGRTPPPPLVPEPPVAPDREQMRAAAGRYAYSVGVTDVAVEGDALRLTSRAQDPAATSALFTLRSDGWYSSDTMPTAIRPTTIAGKRVLLFRGADGTQALLAQRLPSGYAVPRAWRQRVGTYRLRGLPANAYPMTEGVPATAELTLYRGILLLRTPSLDPTVHLVLLPTSKRLAFSFGPTPNQVMRDAGYALEVRDGSLWWQGLRLVPVRPSR